jgi:hypothetical protein
VTGWNYVQLKLTVRGFCPSHRTQIYGPVHGATTHENSATMSLYGYGLAYYVVETSLGMPNMVRIERGSWDLTSSRCVGWL